MEKVLDLSYLNEISGGDKSFIKEMLELFVSTTAIEARDFDGLLQRNDIDAIGKLAHKMKAPIQMLGATALFELVRSLERAGKERNNDAAIPGMITDIKQRVETLSNEISEVLKGL